MSFSVSTIIKENTDFIVTSIQQLELQLQPSNSNDEELVRRAIFAVRNKFITFEKYIPNKSLLQITVQDVRPAKVFINFQEEQFSCDCNKNGWCRHKVSTLLALYQHIDSVQDWLSNWRSKKNVQIEVLASKRTPNSWKRMVQEVFSHFLKSNQNIESNLLTPMMDMILSKLMNCLPFEREWQPIYKLFMEVQALNMIWEHLEKTNTFINTIQFEQFFDNHFETIQRSVQVLAGHSRLFATDVFFDELQNIVRTILLDRKHYEERKIKLYLTFWDKIFIEKKRAMEELNIIKESKPFDIHPNTLMNIFYILLKDVENLQRNLQTLKTKEIPIYFHLAEFSFTRRNDICGEMILKSILPYLHDYIHGHLIQQNRKQFVQHVHSLYENIILTEKEESILFSSYGSYGIHPFSNYLLKMKRYEQWVALHQMYPSSISYLETVGLNEVLEKEPKVVLPLLHFYAMHEIEHKTRLNYKEAAMILKKMKFACHKAGKTNFWNDYINQIQSKFKRLKAFQEELVKENILL